jgi:hypothetical protein
MYLGAEGGECGSEDAAQQHVQNQQHLLHVILHQPAHTDSETQWGAWAKL